jgi:hypothetical protein
VSRRPPRRYVLILGATAEGRTTTVGAWIDEHSAVEIDARGIALVGDPRHITALDKRLQAEGRADVAELFDRLEHLAQPQPEPEPEPESWQQRRRRREPRKR